ncbi:MAG TPA: ATP-dependent DNA helicase [Chloroflexota bacterium]|nr:ATP-dependent DNA helicase [Chloroflexota bacterium]
MTTTARAARRSPIAQILGADGPVARHLPGYNERPGQIAMAELVMRALTRGEHAIVEAGTGTGKSMAYLIPAIYSNKTVIVSTANKALQEQLIRKDIPFLQRVMPMQISAAIVKGRGNYICLDRFRDEEGVQSMLGGTRGWKRLLEWKEHTSSGDFEDLEVSVPSDLRGRVISTTRTCVGQVCDLFDHCFVELAYRRADESKIIICNHALLLADLHLRDMGAFVLPERDAIILDEAHHLEEAAINALSVQMTPADITELLENGLVKRHVDAALLERAARAGMRMGDEIRRVAGSYQKIVTEPLALGESFAVCLDEMAEQLRRENPHKNTMPSKEARRYERVLEWVAGAAGDARLISKVADEDSVRYTVPALEGARDRGPALRWSPVDVSRSLQELLFARYPTICTSATLATRGPAQNPAGDEGEEQTPAEAFRYFRSRVGCEQAHEAIIPSPFEYPSQCLLYVARTMPEFSLYNQDEWAQGLAAHLQRLLAASRGRAFCLFTSYRTLERVYSLLAADLPFPALRQGEAPRPELLRRFKAQPGSVLFATRSFWEGVDVVGEALSLVAIDKMPFSAPDDPVVQARVERMKREGQDWFNDLMLPQATLLLKQGFGRLIRSNQDRGVVAILDSRLIRKGYGRQVINALPPARRTDKLDVVEQFFNHAD